MSTNLSPTRLSGEALAAKRLVKFSSSNTYVDNDAADAVPIGSTNSAVASGEPVSVATVNAEGTIEVTAAGAITNGAAVYAAADGKVQALPVIAGTYYRIGVACEDAAADGDIIEVLPSGVGIAKTVT